MSKQDLIYWDSCVFLSWFKNEKEKAEKCLGTMDKAKKGEILIVTSAVTLTEVIKLEKHSEIPKNDEEKIRAFFENPFIMVASCERKIAETARHLIWKYPHLKPKDSIHLATAIFNGIPTVHSFDNHFLKLNGQIEKTKITAPDIPFEEQLSCLTDSSVVIPFVK